MPSSQQGNKGVPEEAGLIDTYQQGKIVMELHSRVRDKHVFNPGVPPKLLLVIPCSVLHVNGNL